MKRLCILGATGSIGVNTLDVVRQHPEQFDVVALSAGANVDRLYQQCVEFKPQMVVVLDPLHAQQLRTRLEGLAVEVLSGAEALVSLAQLSDVDVVVSAIVGAAGLAPTLAAAQAGKQILLANKESLVVAGQLLLDTALKHGATLLPLDSEHNAVLQCFGGEQILPGTPRAVRQVTLTASGGPFLNYEGDLCDVTPEQACAHPNWSMGRKISVDSATLMNKGLEVIEACLFI